MSDKSSIEWTDRTWNPLTGCTKVSPGCDHCYAKTMHERFNGPGSFDTVQLHPHRLGDPQTWRKPARVFVNSMSDLFHQDVPDDFIARVFSTMRLAPQHTFQVLTKRHARMRSLMNSDDFRELVWSFGGISTKQSPALEHYRTWPARNIWLGVSVENQKWADIRWPELAETSAAVRFISAEPLLGEVSLFANTKIDTGTLPDWVIVGGESGRGARPMHPRWARQLRDECVDYGIPFLFKQRGEWTWNEPGQFRIPDKPYTDRVAVMHAAGMTALTKSNSFNPFERGHLFWSTRIERVGKKKAGRELDGRTWDEYPAELLTEAAQ